MSDTPTYQELLERIEALENRQIKVSDLPLAGLQSKLELSWQPNANDLLAAGSVDAATIKQGSVPILGAVPDAGTWQPGDWYVAFGYQPFTGFTLTPGSFITRTITHNIGRMPVAYYPIIAPQDAGLSVLDAAFRQGSMTTTTMDVTLSNPYSFNLTNALLGWSIQYQ